VTGDPSVNRRYGFTLMQLVIKRKDEKTMKRNGFTLIELLVVPTRSRGFSKPQSAFTLIELLVVIAIIAILAAILFPVFAQARAKARSAACMNNNKQISTATLMYAQDYDGNFPVWGWQTEQSGGRPNGAAFTGKVIWPIAYLPYLKNSQVFACQSDRFQGQGVCNAASPTSCGWAKPFAISLGTNLRIHQCVDPSGQRCGTGRPYPQTRMTTPAETYWIADISREHPIGFESGPVCVENTPNGPWQVFGIDRIRFTEGPSPTCAGDYSMPANTLNPDQSTRHQGGSNIIFADGHVKWLQWRNIKWENTCPHGLNAARTGCAAN